jgi:succinate-semialdehyde dehydrogenase/glutarate-semialdehyde dehydrogenase
MTYEAVNPATGEVVERYPTAGDRQVQEAMTRSAEAFRSWCTTPLDTRTGLLLRVADALDSQAEELGRLMALEMGKPLAEGIAEAKKCALACRWYAEQAASILEPSQRESDGSQAYVRHDPLGPILAIMPWNFPFWQFYRFAAPCLAAGNTILLKHAPNTPGCALRMVALLEDAGMPAGVVQNLFLTNEQAAQVVSDRQVRGVTLTGSTRAGKQVAAIAGGHLKTMVMELGGSDAFTVFADADVDKAVRSGVAARMLNNGQSCIAAKRFLVADPIFERFRDAFVDLMQERVMGDPSETSTRLGPVARRDLRDDLAGQVQQSLQAGARALCGGETADRPGWFYPATVLVDAPPDSPAACQEMFGPVASLFRFKTEDEALDLINGTDYGLGSSLWTSDMDRAQRLIPAIDAGAVFVNGMVKSDPRLPFGGVKESGFGRELGREGMLEFVNLKTVWVG